MRARVQTGCCQLTPKAFKGSGASKVHGGRHVGFTCHVDTTNKNASHNRLCAIKATVTNKGINDGCQCLDLESRENSNMIIRFEGKQKTHRELLTIFKEREILGINYR